MKIDDIALDNKYTKIYLSIVKNAMSRAPNKREAKKILGYVESHHVIPKCIIKNNDVVHLSAKEHFICHLLLTKMFNDKIILQKMNYAIAAFLRKNTHQKRVYTAKQYEMARLAVSVANKSREISMETREKIRQSKKGSKGSFCGKSHSFETKKAISEKKKGRCSGANNSFFGKNHTLKTKDILREKAIERGVEESVKDMLRTVWKGRKRNSENKIKISEYSKKRKWIVNKDGALSHCISLQDPRLLSGEFKLGKIWRD